ncbi:MAG: LolA-related protein [Methylophilaceae bacterium]
MFYLTAPFFCFKPAVRLGLALMLLAYSICHADGWDVEQLMQSLAEATPDHASFVEKKYIAILDKPVESSGELFFTAPDHLEKRTLLPKPESLIVTGNKLIVERGSKKYNLSLQSYPELAILLNSIRGTLAGDLASLRQHFQVAVEGSAQQWTLHLFPLDKKMQSLLNRIHIVGLHSQVLSIEITQADGDSSLMSIKPLDGNSTND